jgi:hypothetical protein
LRLATSRNWVVYAKRPFAGPQQVLAYLSRYTHRVALSPRRLLQVNPQNRTVTFAWKDYADGARHKTMSLEAGEFVRRFSLHFLPNGFTKIRHFGFLSNRNRQTKLAQIKALLQPSPQTSPDQNNAAPDQTASASSGLSCPHCGGTRLRLIEMVLPSFTPDAYPPLDSS